MKYLWGIILLVVFQGCTATPEYITGKTEKNTLNTAEYPWFEAGYDSYIPASKIVNEIKEKDEGVSAIVFMGTWCGDTQRELPRFQKIIEKTTISAKLFALNRDKESPEGTEKTYNIERIPTFIFMRNGKEIGRIVESPKKTLEEDILEILQ